MIYSVVKIDKRLFIVSEGGERVYTPPDFIRHKLNGRHGIQSLADRLNASGKYDIGAVAAFESAPNAILPEIDAVHLEAAK